MLKKYLRDKHSFLNVCITSNCLRLLLNSKVLDSGKVRVNYLTMLGSKKLNENIQEENKEIGLKIWTDEVGHLRLRFEDWNDEQDLNLDEIRDEARNLVGITDASVQSLACRSLANDYKFHWYRYVEHKDEKGKWSELANRIKTTNVTFYGSKEGKRKSKSSMRLIAASMQPWKEWTSAPIRLDAIRKAVPVNLPTDRAYCKKYLEEIGHVKIVHALLEVVPTSVSTTGIIKPYEFRKGKPVQTIPLIFADILS